MRRAERDDPSDPRHGTLTGYNGLYCRCERCKAANTEYHGGPDGARARRRGRGLSGPDDPRHGTVNGYSNWGCRCDRCRDAQIKKMREYREATSDEGAA